MLTFSAATILFYAQKKNFYEEKPLALCLFTGMLSLFLTGTFFLFTFVSEAPPLSWQWVVVDLVVMACADALYALICFSCPMLFYAYLQKGGLRRILHRLRRLRRHDIHEA